MMLGVRGKTLAKKWFQENTVIMDKKIEPVPVANGRD
jgi:hypothetical protein